jgi:hypothetical protein
MVNSNELCLVHKVLEKELTPLYVVCLCTQGTWPAATCLHATRTLYATQNEHTPCGCPQVLQMKGLATACKDLWCVILSRYLPPRDGETSGTVRVM